LTQLNLLRFFLFYAGCLIMVKLMKQIKTNPPVFCLCVTSFGPVTALWSVYRGEPKICRILLSKPGITAKHAIKKFFPDSAGSSCPEIDVVVDQIEAFLNGEDIEFSLDVVRLDLCFAFQQKVLRAEHAIPRGRVSTYNLIAKDLENPNGARAVGTALATNPFPIVIPCHRAIRSDGALGGYQGNVKMKRNLLEMEDIAFREGGHVATGSFLRRLRTRLRSPSTRQRSRLGVIGAVAHFVFLSKKRGRIKKGVRRAEL
jgi:methylated-DNA-[protein]-cysteine S-methyltransferase